MDTAGRLLRQAPLDLATRDAREVAKASAYLLQSRPAARIAPQWEKIVLHLHDRSQMSRRPAVALRNNPEWQFGHLPQPLPDPCALLPEALGV